MYEFMLRCVLRTGVRVGGGWGGGSDTETGERFRRVALRASPRYGDESPVRESSVQYVVLVDLVCLLGT